MESQYIPSLFGRIINGLLRDLFFFFDISTDTSVDVGKRLSCWRQQLTITDVLGIF